MDRSNEHVLNPELDLVIERVVDVPRQRVWLAWTQADQLVKWFTPSPWVTAEAEINLWPGGIFKTVMQSPDGQQFTSVGCYLEVVVQEKLMWTSVLGPGFRPAAADLLKAQHDIPFTGIITLADAPNGGTKYRAVAVHGDVEKRKQHEKLGFVDGWNKSLDQLVKIAKEMT